MSTRYDSPKPSSSPSGKDTREPEFAGSGWKNPYIVYIVLMMALFGGLLLLGYLAWTHGWIPNRGTGQG